MSQQQGSGASAKADLGRSQSACSSHQRGQFTAVVAANTLLCKEHYRLTLRVKGFPPTYPGQFIQVACRNLELDYSPESEFAWEPGQVLNPGGRELISPLALLRRPLSLGGRRESAEGVELELIYRTVGIGTRWLTRLLPGDSLQVAGPMGNHFELPGEKGVAILVGGGVGIPPMLYLAQMLAGRKAVAFCGTMNRDLLPLTITADAPEPKADQCDPLYNIAEFARHGVPAVITTNDGSYGYHGVITDALERYLDRYFAKSGNTPVIYTCGPEGMMKRVAEIAVGRKIECQISVERAMACGMGTCQSCVIRVKKADASKPPLAGKEWCYRLACTDGPIFRATDLLW